MYKGQIEVRIDPDTETPIEDPKKTIAESRQFVMDLKKKSLKDTSYRGLKNRISIFWTGELKTNLN